LYGESEKLPLKVAFHGGYKILLKRARGFGRSKGPALLSELVANSLEEIERYRLR
jgi:hypothetical protein